MRRRLPIDARRAGRRVTISDSLWADGWRQRIDPTIDGEREGHSPDRDPLQFSENPLYYYNSVITSELRCFFF